LLLFTNRYTVEASTTNDKIRKGNEMATVSDLIEQLNTVEDKTQPVVFQYLLAEHTDYTKKEFANRAVGLEYTGFADVMSETIKEWLGEMAEV
jgi:hypothetical protein